MQALAQDCLQPTRYSEIASDRLVAALNQIDTPAYVIDHERLEKNCQRMAAIQEETGAKILLALKAFATQASLPLIAKYLSGATASSVNEARLAAKYFDEVHVYSPSFTPTNIKAMLPLANHFVFNSVAQYKRFAKAVKKQGLKQQVGLRVNPNYAEVKVAMYNPCRKNSRFGLQSTELESLDLRHVDGLHFHALCEQKVDVLARVLQIFEQQYAAYLPNCKWLNMGGGHLLNHHDYDVGKLIKIINYFQDKYELQVILEPGEGVVSHSGVLVSEITDVIYRETPIAILDSSASAHMPDVLEMPYRPAVYAAKDAGVDLFTYELAGSTCLSGDSIGQYSFAQQLKVGDKLIFGDMAPYTMVKNTCFNGIDLPSIYVLEREGDLQLKRSFDYADFEQRL